MSMEKWKFENELRWIILIRFGIRNKRMYYVDIWYQRANTPFSRLLHMRASISNLTFKHFFLLKFNFQLKVCAAIGKEGSSFVCLAFFLCLLLQRPVVQVHWIKKLMTKPSNAKYVNTINEENKNEKQLLFRKFEWRSCDAKQKKIVVQ